MVHLSSSMVLPASGHPAALRGPAVKPCPCRFCVVGNICAPGLLGRTRIFHQYACVWFSQLSIVAERSWRGVGFSCAFPRLSRGGERGDGGQRDTGSCAPSNLPETCREFVCWSLREPLLVLSEVIWLMNETEKDPGFLGGAGVAEL